MEGFKNGRLGLNSNLALYNKIRGIIDKPALDATRVDWCNTMGGTGASKTEDIVSDLGAIQRDKRS